MPRLTILAVLVVMTVLKGLAILALAYLGARLAIRHERGATVN